MVSWTPSLDIACFDKLGDKSRADAVEDFVIVDLSPQPGRAVCTTSYRASTIVAIGVDRPKLLQYTQSGQRAVRLD